jgi:hypothetical protein
MSGQQGYVNEEGLAALLILKEVPNLNTNDIKA